MRKLKENEGERKKVNDLLKLAGMEFKGTIEVRHLAEQLYRDVGLQGHQGQRCHAP